MPDRAPAELPGELDGLLDELRGRAAGWLGRSEPVDVTVRRCEQRPRSILLEVVFGDGQDHRRRAVVKIPKVLDDGPVDRRLVDPVRDAGEKCRREYETLVATARHLETRGDDRFGAVRALDLLPEWPALVVGWVDGVPLDRVLRAGPRGGLPHRDRLTVLERVGAWLAEFHSIATEGLPTRAGDAAEVAADLHMLIEVLDELGRLGARGRSLRELVDAASSNALRHSLVMGLGHGDFAARNVIVGDALQVTVLDSLGRFRVPVHEDLAYLISGISTGSTRFARRQLPMTSTEVGALRAAALAGYGMADDPVLWLFELRSLLDVWQSIARRPRRSGAAGRIHAGTVLVRERIVAREVWRTADRLAGRR